MPLAFVRPNSARFGFAKEMRFAPSRCTTRRPPMPRHADASCVSGRRLTPPSGELPATKQVVQIDDITTHVYDPDWLAAIELGNYRTVVCVPMLKDDELIGAISIFRQEVRPFADKQVDLLQQLRRPGRHRHREHAPAQRAARKSLEQQTATSEVLQVISALARRAGAGVPGDAGERDADLRGRRSASMLLGDGDAFRRVALHNAPQTLRNSVTRSVH